MKFLHAADLHIDSPLRGLDRFPDAPVHAIRTATRRAFTNLINLAIAESVDFVILAGDIFDGSWPDVGTGLFFFKELDRLVDEHRTIPVFAALGNHDAANRLTSRLTWPAHVVRFPHERPHTEVLSQLDVAIHGQSFATEAVLTDLAAGYPDARPQMRNIGILHTALGGYAKHDRYAPTTLGVLHSKGYDAWCLGHVHEREIISRDPLVLYSGNIQGRHVNEAGARGCYIIEDVDGLLCETFHALDVLRWHVVTVDCAQTESWSALLEVLRLTISEQCENFGGRLACFRVELSGATSLDHELREHKTDLRAEIMRIAAERDAWVESVQVKTQPMLSHELAENRSDLFGDLVQSLHSAREEGDLRSRLRSELKDVQLKIPQEVATMYDTYVDDGSGLDEAITGAEAILGTYLQR